MLLVETVPIRQLIVRQNKYFRGKEIDKSGSLTIKTPSLFLTRGSAVIELMNMYRQFYGDDAKIQKVQTQLNYEANVLSKAVSLMLAVEKYNVLPREVNIAPMTMFMDLVNFLADGTLPDRPNNPLFGAEYRKMIEVLGKDIFDNRDKIERGEYAIGMNAIVLNEIGRSSNTLDRNNVQPIIIYETIIYQTRAGDAMKEWLNTDAAKKQAEPGTRNNPVIKNP